MASATALPTYTTGETSGFSQNEVEEGEGIKMHLGS